MDGWVGGWVVGKLESNAKLNSKLKFEVKLKLNLELSLAILKFSLELIHEKIILKVRQSIELVGGMNPQRELIHFIIQISRDKLGFTHFCELKFPPEMSCHNYMA